MVLGITLIERGRLVSRLADALARDADRLARVVVAEQSKPLDQALGEIGASETFLRYAAENARRIEGDILPSDQPDEEVGAFGDCRRGRWRDIVDRRPWFDSGDTCRRTFAWTCFQHPEFRKRARNH